MLRYYYLSLYVIIFANVVELFYRPQNGSLEKVLFNSYLLISLSFIIWLFLSVRKKFANKVGKYFFYMLMVFSVFNILRGLLTGNYITLFGNEYNAPTMLLPMFAVWGLMKDGLYWLNKIGLFSVKLGSLAVIPSVIFDTKLPFSLLMPILFLLLSYKYQISENKIWIAVSSVLSLVIFYIGDLRSGVILIVISYFILIFSSVDMKKIYKFLIPIGFLIAIIGSNNIINGGANIFQIFQDQNNEVLVDTRTFLYIEIFEDLEKENGFLFGKGPLGTYYSDYFKKYNLEGGDHYIRHDVEVGVLFYLLKGGFIYLILIFSTIAFTAWSVIGKSKNQYTLSLGLFLVVFLLYSFISNRPFYSAYYVGVWIIVGLLMSKNLVYQNESQIRKVLYSRELKKSTC